MIAGARADLDLAYPLGVTLCVARLADVREFLSADAGAARSRWRTGLYALHLVDVPTVAQIAIKGALGLFAVPPEIERRINATAPPVRRGFKHRIAARRRAVPTSRPD